MKKIFTLLFCSLLSLSLLAYDGSKLSISTAGKNSNFKIEIDGRKLNIHDNSITLTNISEGTHNVRIFKTRNGGSFSSDRCSELIYAGAVFICKGVHTDITVNQFGKVYIDDRRMDVGEELDNEEDFDDNAGDWNNVYSNVMSTHDFETVKQQLNREWSERNRVGSAKVIIDKSNFTTQQVIDLLSLFTFEYNKLEVAKYAYRKTVDKQNYSRLNEEFEFRSSRDELAEFIRGN